MQSHVRPLSFRRYVSPPRFVVNLFFISIVETLWRNEQLDR
jgi:hypothetical protein